MGDPCAMTLSQFANYEQGATKACRSSEPVIAAVTLVNHAGRAENYRTTVDFIKLSA